MLLAYLDESGTHGGSPNTVMAGFAGTQEQWDGFIPEWQSVLQKYGRRNLHMKRLKFSSPKEQEMLAELGALPLKHKLLMLATYVETDAYNRIVKGKVKPEFSKPYMIVFQKCLYGAAKMAAVKKDSVVLNFERTREYARSVRRMREIAQELRREMFTDIRTLRKDQNPALQAADYLAFETYHWLLDRESVQSVWGISIVGHGNTFAEPATSEWLSQMVEHFRAHGGGLD